MVLEQPKKTPDLNNEVVYICTYCFELHTKPAVKLGNETNHPSDNLHYFLH